MLKIKGLKASINGKAILKGLNLEVKAGGYVDTFEIRGIIEENKIELLSTIKSTLN